MFRWFEKRIAAFPDDRMDPPPSSLAAFCYHYVKDARWWILLLTALSALVAIGEVMLFGFMGRLVDVLADANPETFWAEKGGALVGMGLFVLIGLPALVTLSSLVTHQTLLGNLPMSARWRIHRQLLGQSLSFFSNEFAGRIATKMMQTALATREAVIKLMEIMAFVSVYFLSMISLAAAADWRLAAPLVLWLVYYIALVRYFVPRLRQTSERQADARSAMTGRIVDSYTNIMTVKLFAHAGREETYARDGMDAFLNTVHPQMRYATQFEVCTYLGNCVLVFSVAALGVWLWGAGAVTIGAIGAVVALSLRINGMSQWIMWEVSALFENIGVIHDGMTMLEKPVEVTDAGNAQALTIADGEVEFDKVAFHYGKDKGVIEGLCLRIAPGEKIGLVGRSGAGKTTLTNLLLRFYDVEAGAIRIDGQDVREVTQDSLRSQIGVVTQDTSLLHRSIRDNIAYGRPDAGEDEIWRAIDRANARDFITELEDQKGRTGLDAHVGERGVKLSGGQRQRIAIARTFLKDAPILILDEATSALDSEIEAAIQDNLFALMEGKTVIAIAHRLSTISEMDRLVVLDAGAIVETGAHEALVSKGGLYADLWARQSGGFIGVEQCDAAPMAEQDASAPAAE